MTHKTAFFLYFSLLCIAQTFALTFKPSHDTIIQRGEGNFGGAGTLILKDTSGKAATDRIGLIRYDNVPLDVRPLKEVSLTLTTTANEKGGQIQIWGIKDTPVEAFDEMTISYTGNKAGLVQDSNKLYVESALTYLGDYWLAKDIKTSTFTSDALVEFVSADTNGIISFLLSREESENDKTTAFATKENADSLPPIILSIEPALTHAAAVLPTEILSLTSAKLAAKLVKKPAEDTSIVAFWGLSDGMKNPSDWDSSFTWPAQEANVVVSKTLTDLSPMRKYYYRIASSNATEGLAWVDATQTIPLPYPESGSTNVWIGSGNASIPENWSSGQLPTEDSAIFLGHYSNLNMTWDVDGANGLPSTVKEWIQYPEYSGTVTFPNTFPSSENNVFETFTIAGDCTLHSGTWVHKSNINLTQDTYRMSITTHGNFTIEQGVTVSSWKCGRGRSESDSNLKNKCGPGYMQKDAGAGYAGSSGKSQTSDNFDNTYGSILMPLRLGSGTYNYQSGGAIEFNIHGTFTHNGNLHSNGSGYFNKSGAASGGSILIRANRLEGSGTLTSNGGVDNQHGNASGGRIALYLTGENETFDSFSGAVNVNGSASSDKKRYSGAGTIYRETAADGHFGGQITVNHASSTEKKAYTSIPAKQQLDPEDDLSCVSLLIENHGIVNITDNITLREIKLTGDNSRFWLQGHTVTVSQVVDKSGIVFKKPGQYVDNSNGYFDNMPFADGTIIIPNTASIIAIQ